MKSSQNCISDDIPARHFIFGGIGNPYFECRISTTRGSPPSLRTSIAVLDLRSMFMPLPHPISGGHRVCTGPSYEISPVAGIGSKKVPDSNAHYDHEDQDYEPSMHLLPPISLLAVEGRVRAVECRPYLNRVFQLTSTRCESTERPEESPSYRSGSLRQIIAHNIQ